MREIMASGTFEWPKKAQSNLGWLQKYYFLVLYAKVIQLPCCNSSCKGARGTLHKWLCWDFGVNTIVFVLL